jgi:LEA14-like dessication related protein
MPDGVLRTGRPRSPARRACLAALGALVLGGCAGVIATEPPRVHVIGVERLSTEGFEVRFTLRLRVQNPNPQRFRYDGLAIDLDVNGRPLASGVTAASGEIPGFGEGIVALPVTVNAVAAVRQMLGLLDGTPRGELPYVLRGRLGGPLGGQRFSSEGMLRLP